MESKTTDQLIREYLDLALRGKYLIIVPVIICLIIGSAVAFKLPPIYQSDVKLLYMQPQIPESLQLQTVNMYLESMLLFIEAVTFSRQNSLKLINELDLYPNLKNKVPVEDLISKLKSNYSKELIYTAIPGKGGKTEEIVNGFTFSFNHPTPRKAFQVANVLATDFMENYKKFREGFASQTTTFFEDERERLNEEIRMLDDRISEFKKNNVYELPELFQSNYRMLDIITERLFKIEQEIHLVRAQQKDIETNLTTVSPFMSLEGLSGQRIVSPEEKLAALKSELSILMTTYSDKHPDIIRVRREIRELETIVAERKQKRQDTEGEGISRIESLLKEGDLDGAYNPVYIQLATQLNNLNMELEALKDEKDNLMAQQIEYEQRVGKTPLVEKEYLALQRDLESAQRRYNELSSQVFELESAAAMEKREMGGKLTIGQPPSYPLSPIKPNRPLMVAGSFALGVGLGVLLLLGWNYATLTIRTSQDLVMITEFPVLSELPFVTVEKQKKSLSLLKKYSVRLASLIIIIIVLILVDVFYMKIDVLIMKIFEVLRKKILLLGM